jgi:hypothetical protein
LVIILILFVGLFTTLQKENGSVEPCFSSPDLPLSTSISFMVDYSFQVQEKEKVVPIIFG